MLVPPVKLPVFHFLYSMWKCIHSYSRWRAPPWVRRRTWDTNHGGTFSGVHYDSVTSDQQTGRKTIVRSGCQGSVRGEKWCGGTMLYRKPRVWVKEALFFCLLKRPKHDMDLLKINGDRNRDQTLTWPTSHTSYHMCPQSKDFTCKIQHINLGPPFTPNLFLTRGSEEKVSITNTTEEQFTLQPWLDWSCRRSLHPHPFVLSQQYVSIHPYSTVTVHFPTARWSLYVSKRQMQRHFRAHGHNSNALAKLTVTSIANSWLEQTVIRYE